ncbi:MAG: tRNA (guanosine(37)-N1)-methyltransferase TrmD [Defluviitaleaceae bacterium]|nr:tRNA (guanosine(37)-N1)-methyltransferase TrmD [Defluviitaleaceae bacterium]
MNSPPEKAVIFHILTLFPEMIREAAAHSIIGRAQKAGIIEVNAVNIRDFAVNKYGQVDDAPYGGGAGMVMMASPIFDAVEAVQKSRESNDFPKGRVGASIPADDAPSVSGAPVSNSRIPVIYLSPQGRVLTQEKVRELAALPEIILLCGHYEGVDERVIEEVVTEQISIGDYILTGGEPAAIVLIDAISRLVPGVLGKAESYMNESFSAAREDGTPLLEHPHYTRPAIFRGREVPEILLSGHHGEIAKWRLAKSVERTNLRANQSR